MYSTCSSTLSYYSDDIMLCFCYFYDDVDHMFLKVYFISLGGGGYDSLYCDVVSLVHGILPSAAVPRSDSRGSCSITEHHPSIPTSSSEKEKKREGEQERGVERESGWV